MSRCPFVGISGITDPKSAVFVLSELGSVPGRVVVMSGPRFDFFAQHERLLPSVRFAPERRTGLKEEMEEALGWKRGSPDRLCALDISTPWPNPKEIEPIRRMDGQSVILRVGNVAFDEAWRSPTEVVDRLARYAEAVTDVQFVVNGVGTASGRGALEIADALALIAETRRRLPRMQIGVSGHFSLPGIIPEVLPFLRAHPALSIETAWSHVAGNDDVTRVTDVARFISNVSELAASQRAPA